MQEFDQFSKLISTHFAVLESSLKGVYQEVQLTSNQLRAASIQKKRLNELRSQSINLIEISMDNYIKSLSMSESVILRLQEIKSDHLKELVKHIDLVISEVRKLISKIILSQYRSVSKGDAFKQLETRLADKIGRDYSFNYLLTTLARKFAVLAYVREREIAFRKDGALGVEVIKDNKSIAVLTFSEGEKSLKSNMNIFHPNSTFKLTPYYAKT